MSSDNQIAQEALTFADLGLSPKVLSAVTDAGYTVPTPIQLGAIPHALQGKDVLGIAQTGTGKTASFVLPMLTRLEKGRARARMPRTLILEPTRELAAQVEENFTRYGKNHKLNIALLIGGVSFDEQEKKLERGADVLIATPGRLLDHRERGKLLLNGVEILVIDEADRMLDMGFIPDIERICEMIPFTRQTLFFSATMPPEITKLTEKFLHAPVRVEVSKAASTGTNITQRLVKSGPKPWDKRETLRNLINAEADGLKNAIIFCNRKVEVAELFRSLVKYDFDAGALHGDMDQRARMQMLSNFRDGKLKLLVASDVAARGLDIPEVSHVFNYDVPIHAEDYVHRIGRTGRAGRLGKAFTIVTKSDTKYVDAIERLTGLKIEWHDGDLSTVVASESEDEAPRRGRGAGAPRRSGRKDDGERKPRGERRPRSAEPKPAEEKAQHQPELRSEPVIADNDERPARRDAIKAENAERKARPERADQPRGDRQERPRRDDRNARQRQEDNDGTVGFGDDMPAFMRVAGKV
ncbi:DEAD/DEAH box helicase [Allomesorhizobium camelthorni]|uniref:DEAD-box ATP-dependent RNA helicase RhpA n=1 Tax=Allomesorhizobium camelthorni TaxID=475069 RepID=A0A6G4WEM2_9HYPH|nr:DEAD/DEAH box helicase [Mesorhizobium camelthorni]NGO52676.1 DEAD/DEAH box helicase [Mesorhizobium camelthorni]